MYILGLHGFSSDSNYKLHNTGVAIIQDGKIVAAIDEERYSRKKNDGSFPNQSLQAVFKIAKISPKEINYVVMPDVSPFRQLLYVTKYSFKTLLETGILMHKYWYKTLKRTTHFWRSVPEYLSDIKKIYIEHHLAHAASAYYTSPWENATIITVDGMGDYSMSGIVAKGEAGKINVLKKLNGFYSPGIFYAMVTDYLGFIAGRHEGKVTGLAAFGSYRNLIKEMKDFLVFDKYRFDFYSKILPYEINRYSFEYGKKEKLYSFHEIFKNYSREEIAATAQKILEDVILELVCETIKKTGEKKLVLAGGIFANVKLNQRIRELPCVDNVFIFPAMSDSGLSVGAPLYFYYHVLNNKYNPQPLDNVFLGEEFSNNFIKSFLENNKINYETSDNIEKDIAKYLYEGKIIAHFNGRMEYGPRALGNRSILVRSIDKNINSILNKKLNRSEFMPFAPIVLEEFANDFLIGWSKNHIASKFMTITYNVTDKMKKLAPAVVHVDGTARPQIVTKKEKRLYKILWEYYKISNIPVLINTSFNLHEEPIVNTPQDAIKILNKNAVDILILNDYIIKK